MGIIVHMAGLFGRKCWFKFFSTWTCCWLVIIFTLYLPSNLKLFPKEGDFLFLCIFIFKAFNIVSLVQVLDSTFGVSFCRNPTLAKCGGEAQHLEKLEIWSPPGLPNVYSSTTRGKNTSHWGLLDVIGKVLKRRYRKWPRIGNSDICSPSYGQKKGRESNWQFDSRPLKVWNRPLPDIRFECATLRWKDLDEGYNFGLDLVAIGLCSRELWPFKV